MTRAAVLDPNRPGVVVEDVQTLPDLRPGLVRVQVRASGVCHSDLHVVDGDWPAEEPLVLGHEGAGVVTEVGEGVQDAAVGDSVVLSWFHLADRFQRVLGCDYGSSVAQVDFPRIARLHLDDLRAARGLRTVVELP